MEKLKPQEIKRKGLCQRCARRLELHALTYHPVYAPNEPKTHCQDCLELLAERADERKLS